MGTTLTHAGQSICEVGIASWTLEDALGDGYVVQASEDRLLLAAIDGIGHGREAAAAARIAEATLSAGPDGDLTDLMSRCHDALRGTRGAVVSLASVDAAGALTWLGVGNVEGVLMRPGRQNQVLGMRAGALGHTLPRLYVEAVTLTPGDTLVFATDGIRVSALTTIDHSVPAQTAADAMLADGCKRTDDALVLVACFRGDGASPP